MRRRTAKRRLLQVEPLQFANGLRELTSMNGASPAGVQRPLGVHADIIRSADLVALSVDAIGCELVADSDVPAHLRPIKDFKRPLLVVRYAFQHIGEEAVDESNEAARPPIPVRARAARGSRLVFKIPPDETIEFSSAGILSAMGRFPLSVHKRAAPGDAPMRGTRGGGASFELPIIVLPSGLIARVSGDTIQVSKAKAAELRALSVPPDDTLAGIAFQARELRRMRTLLQSRTAIADRQAILPDHPLFGLGNLIGGIKKLVPRLPELSYPPTEDETAIEAPFRLIVSPSDEARWAHAIVPVDDENASGHVELWHSRLGNAITHKDGSTKVDERNAARRIVRAIWTRDRDEMSEAQWRNPAFTPPAADPGPFLTSLTPADRHMLVRQTSETVVVRRRSIAPAPVAARGLWLSGLGAWLDLHGGWNTRPYSDAGVRAIMAWDHVAPMGRDQYVRVDYPGYLYPWGHQAILTKITERKMKGSSPSVAGLYQRTFIVISEPRRTYADAHHLPFTEVSLRPLTTPNLSPRGSVPGNSDDTFFWPRVDNQPFLFTVDALDHEARLVRLQMPLIWVAEHFGDFSALDATYAKHDDRHVQTFGQSVAFAPASKTGDTALAAAQLSFLGKSAREGSTPRMSSARVSIPAVEQLSPIGPVPIAYHGHYRSGGFGAAANKGQMWARVLVNGDGEPPEETTDPALNAVPQLRFGEGAPSRSDKSGGFLTPDIPIRGLSRLSGTVGDAAGMAMQSFKPKDYFKGSAPKLFGLIPLDELALDVDSDLLRIPQVVSELLGRAEALVVDVQRAGDALADAIAEANAMVGRAVGKPPEWATAAQAAIDTANDAKGTFDGMAAQLPNLLALVKNQGADNTTAENLFNAFRQQVDDTIAEFEKLADKLPPFAGNIIRAMAKLLRTLIVDSTALLEDIGRYVNGLAENGTLARFRFEWTPKVRSWPSGSDPLLEFKREDSLALAMEGRAGFDNKVEVQVLAELRDFALHLFPKAELLELSFDHFSFKSVAGKPEVDIVLHDIEFKGVLSFIEGLKNLVPLDGFSDPPYMDVKPEGMTAGFNLALPDIALGMFSVTNLSLGSDVLVPFIGKAVSIGFNFCTRERPFTIAVAFLGGGGWCGIRASANGLDVLEVGLEAGACIAVNFGVASGSVSAMLGVYIRLESEAGSITGYFRLRGQVTVLALVSAGIELYMALEYHYQTGKLIGQASITVNVTIVGLSKEVRISTQRVFAGSNGDPSFLEVMDAADGTSQAWRDYCLAFGRE